VSFHEDHDLRRGPMVTFRLTAWACIDCRSWGEAPHELVKDAPDWTEEDYWNNVDWIEA